MNPGCGCGSASRRPEAGSATSASTVFTSPTRNPSVITVSTLRVRSSSVRRPSDRDGYAPGAEAAHGHSWFDRRSGVLAAARARTAVLRSPWTGPEGAADRRRPLEISCPGSPRRPVCGAVCAASTEACVRARDGAGRIALAVIHSQLGHAHLGIASIYLQGIDTREIAEAVHHRRPPVIPASADLRPSRAIRVARLAHITRTRVAKGGQRLCHQRALPRLSESGSVRRRDKPSPRLPLVRGSSCLSPSRPGVAVEG